MNIYFKERSTNLKKRAKVFLHKYRIKITAIITGIVIIGTPVIIFASTQTATTPVKKEPAVKVDTVTTIQPKEEIYYGWNNTKNGKLYRKDNSLFARNEYLDINGHMYYFDSGCHPIISQWYDGHYFNSNGCLMRNTTISVDNTVYNLDEDGFVIEEPEPEYIPNNYNGLSVGYVWDTAFGYRSDWNRSSPQFKMQCLWESEGCTSKDNVMTLNDKYMIACKDTFGQIGDWITFGFENGTTIECVVYDEKGSESNSTIWGHIETEDWSTVKVLEFYMENAYAGIPFMDTNNRVCSWINHGRCIPDNCAEWG